MHNRFVFASRRHAVTTSMFSSSICCSNFQNSSHVVSQHTQLFQIIIDASFIWLEVGLSNGRLAVKSYAGCVRYAAPSFVKDFANEF